MEIQTVKIAALSACAALLLACGCKRNQPRISHMNIDPDSLPAQEFFDSTRMTLTEKNKKLWSLSTTHLIKYRRDSRIFIDPVEVIYYTRDGTSRLTADSGTISNQMDTLTAHGNVDIITSDNRRVTTTAIAWDKHSGKVTSDRFVKMVTPDRDVYSGTGFIANTDLTEWKILHNVRARIHQVESKMD
jgi:LPS export ABC transporter protein LptC